MIHLEIQTTRGYTFEIDVHGVDNVSAAAERIREEAGLMPDREVEIKMGDIVLSQDESFASQDVQSEARWGTLLF